MNQISPPSLTERQTKILRAIVEEYSETAEPVGSDTLDKKYQIGVSPATIRNEMNRLVEKGYLSQPHTSAGRTPTPTAIKYYVNQIMEEKELPVTDEVRVKQQIWDSRDEIGLLLRQVTHALADQTHMLSVAATDQGKAYHSGYANILEVPEFYDIDVTKTVLSLIDEVKDLMELFNRPNPDENDIDTLRVLIGDDIGIKALSPVGIVFTPFKLGGITGAVGILGPCRLDYSYIIPTIRYVGNLLNEIGVGW